MNRTISSVKIGSEIRHRVKILSDPCAPGTQKSRFVAYQLLETLAQLPELTLCGTLTFQTLSMRETDSGWLVEAEALEPVETVIENTD